MFGNCLTHPLKICELSANSFHDWNKSWKLLNVSQSTVLKKTFSMLKVYLQLSIIRSQFWVSKGNNLRSISHCAVRVILKQRENSPINIIVQYINNNGSKLSNFSGKNFLCKIIPLFWSKWHKEHAIFKKNIALKSFLICHLYTAVRQRMSHESAKTYAPTPIGIMGSKSLVLLDWGSRRFSNKEREKNEYMFVLFPSTTLKHLVHSSNRKYHHYP